VKIIRKHWFTSPRGTVGIVVAEHEFGGKQIYISPVSGKDESNDIRYIVDWGVKIDPSILICILADREEKK
jgi:hypothetical protein